MDMAYTFILMEQDMMGLGKMISNMVKELRNGMMGQHIAVIMLKERNKEKDSGNGKMGVHMKVNFSKTIFMDMEIINGMMEDLILGTGS